MPKKTQYQHISQSSNKPNEKPAVAIKPYWYIDPSIVYRAMTSPVKHHPWLKRDFSFQLIGIVFLLD